MRTLMLNLRRCVRLKVLGCHGTHMCCLAPGLTLPQPYHLSLYGHQLCAQGSLSCTTAATHKGENGPERLKALGRWRNNSAL